MKFEEYVGQLRRLLMTCPETGDMDVLTAKDDEGNGYNQVYYSPSVVHFDGEEVYNPEEYPELGKPNAVVVN